MGGQNLHGLARQADVLLQLAREMHHCFRPECQCTRSKVTRYFAHAMNRRGQVLETSTEHVRRSTTNASDLLRSFQEQSKSKHVVYSKNVATIGSHWGVPRYG